MAYKGYLIKIGNYIFPLSMIKAESYKATNYGQDSETRKRSCDRRKRRLSS